MDKRTFIRNTSVFLVTAIIIFLFKDFLGMQNVFVGITIARAAVMLIDKDLTGRPIRNLIKFFLVDIYLGVFPFLADYNIYLGLFINFFAIFIIAYILIYNLELTVCFPFILGYLYLLTHPVSIGSLPLRLLGLSFGAVFIMVVQLIFNRNKCKNTINENIKIAINGIDQKINSIIIGDFSGVHNNSISDSLNEIISAIYEKRDGYFNLKLMDNVYMNLALCLERINASLLDIKYNKKEEVKDFLEELIILLDFMEKFALKEISLDDLRRRINDFLEENINNKDNNYFKYEIMQEVQMLVTSIKDSKIKVKKGLRKYIFSFNKFEIDNIIKFNFTKMSLKFTYSFRVAFLISITYFVVEKIHLDHGGWILMTIFALTQPYTQDENVKRGHMNLRGNLGGVIIFILVDLFIKSSTIKMIIVFILYYAFVYIKDTIKRNLCTTSMILILLSIYSPSNIDLEVLHRVVYIMIGTVIAYLGNKFIFPYSLENSIKKLIVNYYNISKDMIIIGEKNYSQKNTATKMNNLILVAKILEKKILLNNTGKNKDIVVNFINNQRLLNESIYFLFFNLETKSAEENIKKDLCNMVNLLDLERDKNEQEVRKMLNAMGSKIKLCFESNKNPQNKMIIANFGRIISRLEKSKILISSLIN